MIPFVMAGTTNRGIVGNTFYRDTVFGAGDDTGVFWNNSLNDQHILLYLETVIGKGLANKYDFGHKLRASQSYDLEFMFPSQNKQPDYTFISNLIRAVEKLVIKDLVQWLDKEIVATKEVVVDH